MSPTDHLHGCIWVTGQGYLPCSLDDTWLEPIYPCTFFVPQLTYDLLINSPTPLVPQLTYNLVIILGHFNCTLDDLCLPISALPLWLRWPMKSLSLYLSCAWVGLWLTYQFTSLVPCMTYEFLIKEHSIVSPMFYVVVYDLLVLVPHDVFIVYICLSYILTQWLRHISDSFCPWEYEFV